MVSSLSSRTTSKGVGAVREFDKPIGRVWRRLRLQRFVTALVWCLVACLGIAAVIMAVEKLSPWSLPGSWWWPLAGAAGLATVVAAGIALFTGPSRVDAAVAIDHAFDLNERLSTALTLPNDLKETAAGRALMADAIRHVENLDIGSKFGLRRPRLAWIPIVPAVLAVAMAYLPEGLIPRAGASGKGTQKPLDKKVVTNQLKTLGKAFQEKRKTLEKVEATETGQLMAKIEDVFDKMAKSPPTDQEKALVEMNKLSDAVKERQRQLGSAEQVNRQLEQLKDMSDGPADEFAKDLAKGDFQKAASDLKTLQEKMASGKLTEPEKQALQRQLSEMKQQLEKMASLEQRRKQLQEAMEKGAISKEQYQQQMAKLDEQAKDLQALKQLAQQLGEASQQMASGDMKKAADALGASQDQLQEMARQVQELETLDQALADLQDAKNGMAGDGMNQLGQQLEGMNGLGMEGSRPGNGFGLGRGRGQGDRPEAPDNVASYQTRVRQQIGKGKAVVGGFADPTNQIKGESVLEIQETIATAAGTAAEALTEQKIPKSVEKHVLDYFDKVRKGD